MRSSPPSTRPRSSPSPSPTRHPSSRSNSAVVVVPPPPPKTRPPGTSSASVITRQPSGSPFSPQRGPLTNGLVTEEPIPNQQHIPSPRGPALAIRPSLPPLARGSSSPSSSSSLLAAHQAEIIPPSSGISTPTRSADGRRSPPSSLPSKHRLQSSSVRRAPPPPPAALPSPLRGMQPPLLSDAQRADDTFSTASFGPLNYSFGGTTTAITTAVQTPTTTTTIQNPVTLTRSSSYIVERTIDAPTHSSSSPLQMPMPMRPHTQHSTQPSHPQHHHLPRAAVITVPSFESVASPVIVPSSFQRVASRSPPLTYHQHAGAAGGAVITTSDRASTSSPGSSWRGGDGEGVPLVTFPSPVQTNTSSSRCDVSLSSGAVVGGGGRSVPINNNNNSDNAATGASPSPSGTTATTSAQQQHTASPQQHQHRPLDDFNRAAAGAAEDVSPHRRRLELSLEEQQPQQSSSAQRSLRIVSPPSQVAPTTSSLFYLGRVATAPVSPLRDEMYRQRTLSSASSSTAVVTNVSANNRDPFVDWCVAVASSVEMQLGGRAGSNGSGNF
ncbi:Hypothetical protein, putative [Bodo saltans]|uniref:Uncharacterized protein n=1 Tax=Bodo saltans TaxID=75058 RepID=A0A0S4INP6_BODSA|nr:Hypothetical protein, putative [Bodo saltans]|eukprot:CUE83782.1 Hypothetical protein, putative [Bodo saltans]